MAIEVVHDGMPKDELKERCCFCRSPTQFWHPNKPHDVAVCPSCASDHEASELPTKKDWCEQERQRLSHWFNARLAMIDAALAGEKQ